jgi:hypothetical protein
MASAERPPRPVFWKELYWFAVISVFGVTLALAVIPPRAGRLRRLHDLQAQLETRERTLERRERALEAAIDGVENDRFYREAVYRNILGVRKKSEEFLDLPPAVLR